MRLHLTAPLAALLACALTLHTLTAAAQNTAPAAAKPAQPNAEEMRKIMDATAM